jgi:hypothetical protein
MDKQDRGMAEKTVKTYEYSRSMTDRGGWKNDRHDWF